MSTESNLEFVGQMKPQKLTSLEDDFKAWRSEIHADQERWKKYGTNSAKKATQIESGQVEELNRERFPEEG